MLDKNYLIQVTNELYKLTLLFPKKEPLRYKMREIADEILVNSLRITCPPSPSAQADGRRANQSEYTNTRNKEAENCSRQILEDLEIMDGFFEVAKKQNWVSPAEILKLQQEYNKVGEELKKIKVLSQIAEKGGAPSIPAYEIQPCNLKPQPKILDPKPGTSRQRKILEFLKEKGKAQVWEIKEIFPSVTKRTLRRDFRNLLNKGLIKRLGKRNETFYQLGPKEIGQTPF